MLTEARHKDRRRLAENARGRPEPVLVPLNHAGQVKEIACLKLSGAMLDLLADDLSVGLDANPFKPGEFMDVKAKPTTTKIKVRPLKNLKAMA
jgi:hypothetical protein